MFACLYSVSAPLARLVKVAGDFTPRFEVVGPLVMLDVSGLSRLFGELEEIGAELRRASGVPVRVVLAPTQTGAALLALGRPGLTIVGASDMVGTLASLPVTLLGEFERLRLNAAVVALRDVPASPRKTLSQPPNVAEMEDVLPYFHGTLAHRESEAAMTAHCGCGGGWKHPRDSHIAARRPRRPVSTPRTPAAPVAPLAPVAPVAPRKSKHSVLDEIDALLDTLRRWGVKTLSALAVLPCGDVYERLGARGVLWQRLARGEDTDPLVPWVPDDPFEGALDLEWPIEGLEPLSFVLGRLLDPLAGRLERADRGAVVLHTHLRLVNGERHTRTLQLPAPMRDPKTLRTLMLLDLESNPPAAAVDQVRVLIEPTPARVTQWMLFERAQPSPEQVSTLLARLMALMGDRHVGSPRLLNSWKPGAFEMTPFVTPCTMSAHQAPHSAHEAPGTGHLAPVAPVAPVAPASVLRRFRLPVPARVHVHEGRPIRVSTDRRGVIGGAIVHAAGPWRTSGEWWNDTGWDRDEWDVALRDGIVYRLYVERDVGQWFLEGVVD